MEAGLVAVTRISGPGGKREATRRFVLASASPARRRLLESCGLRPDVMISGFDEDTVTESDPIRLVTALANAKADAVCGRVYEALVLGCDSMLEVDGRAYGKPADHREARRRWHDMAGRSGILHTGHCLLDVHEGYVRKRLTEVASTVVHFGEPTPAELDAYVRSGEPMQVAGAFTLEGLGGWFVERIEGDHGTVLGLSLPLLRRMLATLGVSPVELWT
ncbi:MAG TPA: Maf family protein [Mycobacteriales bacterium]|nr:Maf family protein [Mycobacteriales bacterium]